MVGILYQYLNRNPALGIITAFLGLTLGYGTGFIFNYNDYALGMLTQEAAISVDANYVFNLSSNLYIMIISSVAISFLITMLIEKYLTKIMTLKEEYEDDIKVSKKASSISLIALVISLIPIFIMILPGGILLDNTQEYFIAKIFSTNAPFNYAFIYIFLYVITICSIVYGLVSNNFKSCVFHTKI